MSEKLWYYELPAGEVVGPVPLSKIDAMIAAGEICQTDRIRQADAVDWITADELPSFHAANELDINSFTFASSSDLPEPEVDIDAFNLVSDSEVPQPAVRSRSVAVAEPAVQKTMYHVRSIGHVLGPMSRDEVIQMAKSGSLSLTDEIQIGDLDWETVKAISQIAEHVKSNTPAKAADVGTYTMKRIGAAADSKASKPGVAKSGSSSVGPGPKRKRKQRATADPLLKEIFEEVFTDEGELNRERLAPKQPTASTPNGTASSASQSFGGSASSTAVAPSPPSYGAQTGVAPAPRFVPSKKKSSSSFEMPDSKVMGGIVGGLLAVVLLVGSFTGMIPIFGVDPNDLMTDIIRDCPIAYRGTEDDWNAFKSRYFVSARNLVQQVANDPNAGRLKDSATSAYKLLAISWESKETIPDAFGKLKKNYIGG